ncbi:MAG: hypothetical protein ABFS46_14860 [Myxococcota bacterium]
MLAAVHDPLDPGQGAAQLHQGHLGGGAQGTDLGVFDRVGELAVGAAQLGQQALRLPRELLDVEGDHQGVEVLHQLIEVLHQPLDVRIGELRRDPVRSGGERCHRARGGGDVELGRSPRDLHRRMPRGVQHVRLDEGRAGEARAGDAQPQPLGDELLEHAGHALGPLQERIPLGRGDLHPHDHQLSSSEPLFLAQRVEVLGEADLGDGPAPDTPQPHGRPDLEARHGLVEVGLHQDLLGEEVASAQHHRGRGDQ